jgi:hypothetical protein
MHVALLAALLLTVFVTTAAEAPIPLWLGGAAGPRFAPGAKHHREND